MPGGPKAMRWMAAASLALALFLQSLVGAYALGASANTPQFDAFGNPLCASGIDYSKDGQQGPGHVPECCKFGCAMFWPGLAAPLDIPAVPVAVSISIQIFPGDDRSATIARPDYDPGNPRAPPLTV